MWKRTIQVENNDTHTVGNDRSRTVENNESVNIKVDQTIVIGNDRTETVGNNETITIGNDRTEQVGSNETITIGSNRTESVGAGLFGTDLGLTLDAVSRTADDARLALPNGEGNVAWSDIANDFAGALLAIADAAISGREFAHGSPRLLWVRSNRNRTGEMVDLH